jgi:hypothetical protein
MDDTPAIPCHTDYHLHCIRARPPFRTRLRNGAGLTMPPIRNLPNFICEACTVRAMLDRKLQDHSFDHTLLLLERIRLIDMCHNWSLGTHSHYQGKHRILHDFESPFGVRVLRATPVAARHSYHVSCGLNKGTLSARAKSMARKRHSPQVSQEARIGGISRRK